MTEEQLEIQRLKKANKELYEIIEDLEELLAGFTTMKKGWNVSGDDVREFINEEDIFEVFADLLNGEETTESLRQKYDRWELTLIKEDGTQ